MYCPNINKEIEDYMNNCETCLNYRNSNSKQLKIRLDILDEAWEIKGKDIMTVKGKYYLIVIDYFPKFIHAESFQRLDGKTALDTLKSIF